MSPSINTQEPPKSLQCLISEAATTVKSWSNGAEAQATDEDEILSVAADWVVRLSKGQYEEDLYWECVAEDCEEAGNWEEAKTAYRNILSLTPDSFKRASAYSSLAGLCSILGKPRQALAYLHAASDCERKSDSNIFYRYRLAQEASQLLQMGRVRAAIRLAQCGLSTFESGHNDYLNLALLEVVVAACQLERSELAGAKANLSDARSQLEALQSSCEQWGIEVGSGIHNVYRKWWRTEAKRCQLASQPESQIEALQNSLERARLAAAGWNRVGWDMSVVFALEALADAYKRNGREPESEEAIAEANRIRERWHLPTTPKTAGKQVSILQKLWNLLIDRT